MKIYLGKWVYCTKSVNGVVKKEWKEPLFIHKIKWWYKMNIKGYKKYLNKEGKNPGMIV